MIKKAIKKRNHTIVAGEIYATAILRIITCNPHNRDEKEAKRIPFNLGVIAMG